VGGRGKKVTAQSGAPNKEKQGCLQAYAVDRLLKRGTVDDIGYWSMLLRVGGGQGVLTLGEEKSNTVEKALPNFNRGGRGVLPYRRKRERWGRKSGPYMSLRKDSPGEGGREKRIIQWGTEVPPCAYFILGKRAPEWQKGGGGKRELMGEVPSRCRAERGSTANHLIHKELDTDRYQE